MTYLVTLNRSHQ